MGSYLITDVSLYGEKDTDILVVGGQFAALGPEARALARSQDGVEQIDGTGLIALPGMVDLHTHLREPGREDAETVLTGSQSAATGGFTAVHAMANSTPVADNASVVELVNRLGEEAGYTQVRPVGAVSVGLAGEQLAEIGAMASSTAHVQMFSDDGHCVSDAALMRRALEYVKTFDGFIAQHAQEPRLSEGAQMNEGDISAELGMPGWPAVAEESIIARDVLLAKHTGSRLHICHVSTSGSVELLRWAKAQGIDVTAEVTPHHLVLTDELVRSFDPIYKVNPPLRTAEDVQALRQAVAEGIIDVIGTDHAPHPNFAKECEWASAAMGMTGLETALATVKEALIDTGMITWRDFARITSQAPAHIARLESQGHDFEPGAQANFILVDPEERWEVDPSQMATKGTNTPFRGHQYTGRVCTTFYRGQPVFRDGSLGEPWHAQSVAP